MSNPEWPQALKSAVNGSTVNVSILGAVPVEVTCPDQPWQYLEDRVSQLEKERPALEALRRDVDNLIARVNELEEAHQRTVRRQRAARRAT